MKVLLIGAGWYGCHAGKILLKHGIPFKIVDITNGFFNGSSSKNQNRLHLGFHYPRSYKTRIECLNGYTKFMKTYGEFSSEIQNNYYIIEKSSIVDYQTYCNIYSYEGYSFDRIDSSGLNNIFEGAIKVNERFIDFRKAKLYFQSILSEFMILDYDKDKLIIDNICISYDGEEFDILIDCTYSTIDDMYYEKCVSLLYEYKGVNTFAITVMDGNYCSLYPYDIENKLYTLTDVEYTPYGTEEVRDKMEEKAKCYIDKFDEQFEYKGFFISQKAKMNNINSDDRSFVWKHEKNRYWMSGGKITGIFEMEDVILKHIIGNSS